jgi:hypothetical protein
MSHEIRNTIKFSRNILTKEATILNYKKRGGALPLAGF